MTKNLGKFTVQNAMPFWCSVGLIPLIWFAAGLGGWGFLLVFFAVWYLFSALDMFTGLNLENADPETEDDDLFWYRLVTVIWAPLQFVTLFGLLWYSAGSELASWEKIGLFLSMGIISGAIGINYSH